MDPTVIQPVRSPSVGRTRLLDTSIPDELLAQHRRRIGRLTTGVVVFAVLVLGMWVVYSALGWSERWVRAMLPSISALVAAMAVGFHLLATRSRISDLNVLRLTCVFIVVITGILSFMHVMHEVSFYGQVTAFGPYAVLIGLFPILVPLTRRQTLFWTLVAASTVPVGIFCANLNPNVELTIRQFVDLATVPLLAAIAAFGLASTLTRLRAEISAARKMGSYELEEKIGHGGMGEVWRASHRMLARDAAIKLIRPMHTQSDAAYAEAVERFRREAQATAQLESPHTVRLFDFGLTQDAVFYFAMELLDGIDLEELVAVHGMQDPARVVDILVQVCDSLAEAHERGMVHRDIKPANVMLCRVGRNVDHAKVLDFGIVALREDYKGPRSGESDRITEAGTVVGTPSYMAPETLMGKIDDPRSDIYALGCVAYWLLTGLKPFDGDNPAEIVASIIRDDPVPMSDFRPLPPGLDDIVLGCLARNPADRPQNADELANLLMKLDPQPGWTRSRALRWWEIHMGPAANNTKESGPITVRGAAARALPTEPNPGAVLDPTETLHSAIVNTPEQPKRR